MGIKNWIIHNLAAMPRSVQIEAYQKGVKIVTGSLSCLLLLLLLRRSPLWCKVQLLNNISVLHFKSSSRAEQLSDFCNTRKGRRGWNLRFSLEGLDSRRRNCCPYLSRKVGWPVLLWQSPHLGALNSTASSCNPIKIQRMMPQPNTFPSAGLAHSLSSSNKRAEELPAADEVMKCNRIDHRENNFPTT